MLCVWWKGYCKCCFVFLVVQFCFYLVKWTLRMLLKHSLPMHHQFICWLDIWNYNDHLPKKFQICISHCVLVQWWWLTSVWRWALVSLACLIYCVCDLGVLKSRLLLLYLSLFVKIGKLGVEDSLLMFVGIQVPFPPTNYALLVKIWLFKSTLGVYCMYFKYIWLEISRIVQQTNRTKSSVVLQTIKCFCDFCISTFNSTHTSIFK